jgi:hypothetical protein
MYCFWRTVYFSKIVIEKIYIKNSVEMKDNGPDEALETS